MSGRIRFHLDRARRRYATLEQERKLLARFPTARLEDGVHVVSPWLLELGQDVLVQRNTLLHCGGRAWSGGAGRIALGDCATISSNCVLFGAGTIEIGRRFGCGPGCMIFSSRDRFEPERDGGHVLAPVRIHDDVLLFAGCVVGPGVTIGEGAIVAAGSVVLDDVPAHTLVGGTPARLLRALRGRPNAG